MPAADKSNARTTETKYDPLAEHERCTPAKTPNNQKGSAHKVAVRRRLMYNVNWPRKIALPNLDGF